MKKTLSAVFLFILIHHSVSAQIEIQPCLDSTDKELYILFKNKSFVKGIAAVTELIDKNPEEGRLYFNRGVFRYCKDRNHNSFDEDIMNDCEKASELGYDAPELSYLMFSQQVVSRLINGKEIMFEDAEGYISNAIYTNPKDLRYRLARIELFQEQFWNDQMDNYLPMFERDLQSLIEYSKSKNDKAAAFQHLSNIELYKKDDTLKAISYLSDGLMYDPNNITLLESRASMRNDLKDFHGAIKDYSSYLAIKKTASAYLERGTCYFVLNKNSQALVDINTAISLYQKERAALLQNGSTTKLNYQKIAYGRAYRVRGLIHYELKNRVQSCSDFSKAIELGDTVAKSNMAEYCP